MCFFCSCFLVSPFLTKKSKSWNFFVDNFRMLRFSAFSGTKAKKLFGGHLPKCLGNSWEYKLSLSPCLHFQNDQDCSPCKKKAFENWWGSLIIVGNNLLYNEVQNVFSGSLFSIYHGEDDHDQHLNFSPPKKILASKKVSYLTKSKIHRTELDKKSGTYVASPASCNPLLLTFYIIVFTVQKLTF